VHRELVSDLLRVEIEEGTALVPFRDVFEVDGRPVRDRSDRLMTLFVRPTSATLEQARAIVAEGARYDLGSGTNVDVPLTNRDLPASGQIDVDLATSAIVATELNVTTAQLELTVALRYALDPKVTLNVPVDMHETFRDPSGRLTGRATYANYREFQVHVSGVPDGSPLH
jgi:hypothetical protein